MGSLRLVPSLADVLRDRLSEDEQALVRDWERQVEDFCSRPHELVFHFPGTPSVGDTRGGYALPAGARVRRVIVSALDAGTGTTTADVKLDGVTAESTSLAASETIADESMDVAGRELQVVSVTLSAVGSGVSDVTVQVILE